MNDKQYYLAAPSSCWTSGAWFIGSSQQSEHELKELLEEIRYWQSYV
jgi:hypothetical protein